MEPDRRRQAAPAPGRETAPAPARPASGASPSRRPGLAVLAALFACSGAASLMDQVVWLRYLTLTFGNTTYAAATLLAVFLGGLGLGALVFGRFADRLRRPLTVYAAIEVAVAAIALASPALFEVITGAYVALYRAWGNHPALFAAGRAALAAVFLLPPTLLMGGTLPLMLRAARRREGRVGTASAALYGANTLGAVAGVALSGFLWIPTLGLSATLLLAAAFNLVAAFGAVALSRPTAPEPRPLRRAAPVRRWLLALFFLMGATSLAYEVLWTRVLVFYLGSSVYAYSLMLFLFLLGVAAGSLLAAPWADRVLSPLRALAWLELGIALAVALQIGQFQVLNATFARLAAVLTPEGFSGALLVQLLALVPVLAPPTLLMGASFPLAVRALSRDPARLGADVGAVYGVNTVGSVAGSLAAGFLLIPLLGTQDSLIATAAVNAALGAAVWILLPRWGSQRGAEGIGESAGEPVTPSRWRWAAAAAPAALLALVALLPPDRVILSAGMFRHDAPEDLVFFHEDASASVTIRSLPSAHGPYLSLEINGVNVAGTSPDLYAIQKLQGHLPLLLAGGAESVLHIGFGSGGTAHAVSTHPVEEIEIAEISAVVIASSDRFFGHLNHGVLADPRVRVEINDGRNHLLATPETFDAILSDSIHPRYAGNGSLYSREYFRLLEARLAPGGVASMWLPMYSLTPRNYAMILKAFRDVFPHIAIWYEPSSLNSFTVVTGKREAEPWSAAHLERAFADPRIAGELADLGFRGPADLLACYLGGSAELAPWLDEVPPHQDDLPAVEYESGALIARDWTWLANFARLLSLRPPAPPAAYLEALPAIERARAEILFRERRSLLEDQLAFLAREVRSVAP